MEITLRAKIITNQAPLPIVALGNESESVLVINYDKKMTRAEFEQKYPDGIILEILAE